jgi:hypothetical protein
MFLGVKNQHRENLECRRVSIFMNLDVQDVDLLILMFKLL